MHFGVHFSSAVDFALSSMMPVTAAAATPATPTPPRMNPSVRRLFDVSFVTVTTCVRSTTVSFGITISSFVPVAGAGIETLRFFELGQPLRAATLFDERGAFREELLRIGVSGGARRCGRCEQCGDDEELLGTQDDPHRSLIVSKTASPCRSCCGM